MPIILSKYWNSIQGCLFRGLSDLLDEQLTDKHKEFALTLEVARIENHVPARARSWTGRPSHDMRCIARAFVAKAVYNISTTESLAEHLRTDANLRTLCGWKQRRYVPSLATFSRVFAKFSKDGLGDVAHQAMVVTHVGEAVVMHISRDSTPVLAREKPAKKEKSVVTVRKRGRPRKGEER